MMVTERLALTEDGSRVVPYDSPEARFLFAAPGQEIPDALAQKYGLLDPLPDEKELEPKDPEPPFPEDPKEAEVKQAKKPKNKGLTINRLDDTKE